MKNFFSQALTVAVFSSTVFFTHGGFALDTLPREKETTETKEVELFEAIQKNTTVELFETIQQNTTTESLPKDIISTTETRIVETIEQEEEQAPLTNEQKGALAVTETVRTVEENQEESSAAISSAIDKVQEETPELLTGLNAATVTQWAITGFVVAIAGFIIWKLVRTTIKIAIATVALLAIVCFTGTDYLSHKTKEVSPYLSVCDVRYLKPIGNMVVKVLDKLFKSVKKKIEEKQEVNN